MGVGNGRTGERDHKLGCRALIPLELETQTEWVLGTELSSQEEQQALFTAKPAPSELFLQGSHKPISLSQKVPWPDVQMLRKPQSSLEWGIPKPRSPWWGPGSNTE